MKIESPRNPEDQTKARAAEAIAMEASALARLANSHNFGLLAHLIDMVVLEAWRQATEPEAGGAAANTAPQAVPR